MKDPNLQLPRPVARWAQGGLGVAQAPRVPTAEQRLLLLEDRERIARDLHDHVIQRLFAAGMSLQGAVRVEEAERIARIESAVTDIDEVIAQIRSTIFGLRSGAGSDVSGARSRVVAVSDAMAPQLGFQPRLCFSGPIDALVSDELAEEIVAVVRESLTNVAKHAMTDHVSVDLSAKPALLVIDIVDDGVGVAAAVRRSGLENLSRRAEQRGGSMHVGPAPAGYRTSTLREGTHLQWTIPLP